MFKNALKIFEREDVAVVDCGDGWTASVKSLASVMPLIKQKQAQLHAKGKKLGKGAVQSVKDVVGEESLYAFGSYEADVEFFCQHVLVGWDGLRNDDGDLVPYSTEVAQQLILESGEAGKRLYRELTAVSLDDSLFIKTKSERIEEDAKN